jgi:hypothetical protein
MNQRTSRSAPKSTKKPPYQGEDFQAFATTVKVNVTYCHLPTGTINIVKRFLKSEEEYDALLSWHTQRMPAGHQSYTTRVPWDDSRVFRGAWATITDHEQLRIIGISRDSASHDEVPPA